MTPDRQGRVIVLNGASSSGKSSIGHALLPLLISDALRYHSRTKRKQLRLLEVGFGMSATIRQETYLPAADLGLAQVHDFIEAHERAGRGRPEPRYFLAGAEPGDRVEVPAEIHQVLRQVVDALRQGYAVTVAPVTQTLTTQQAADLLGVSRPTLIRLLDEGRVPYERVGTHRRVLLRDLLAYRERRRAEQYAALEATSVDIDDEDDLETTLRELREARRTVAAKRRRDTPESAGH